MIRYLYNNSLIVVLMLILFSATFTGATGAVIDKAPPSLSVQRQLVWSISATPCDAATLANAQQIIDPFIDSCTESWIRWDPDSILNIKVHFFLAFAPSLASYTIYYPIYDGNKNEYCQSANSCGILTDDLYSYIKDEEYAYDCSNIYCGPNAIRDCFGNSMTVPCTDSLDPLSGTFKYLSSECTAEWNGASCTCSVCGVSVWGPFVIVDCSTDDVPLAFDQCSMTSSGVYAGSFNPELQLGLDSCPNRAPTNANDGSAANPETMASSATANENLSAANANDGSTANLGTMPSSATANADPSAANANDGSVANLGTGPSSGIANADPSAANTDRGKESNGTNHTADSTTNAAAAEQQQQNETLSMLMLMPMVSECILFGVVPLLIMVYCTIQYQCRIVSKLILITMVLYGISYSILRYFAKYKYKSSLQPKLSSWVVTVPVVVQQQGSAKQEEQKIKKQKKQLQYAASSEWRSRLLAILNAILLVYGCLFCFMEWSTYIPESKGWVFTQLESDSLSESLESLESDTTSSFNSLRNNNPVIFYASLFLGYLQWDILWLLYHRKDQSSSNFIGTFIHHIIFISISQYVLSGTYFCKPFAWLSLTELSTPFLHIRWLLAATGSNKNENYTNIYYYISLCFAITFIVTRVIGYGLGLIDIWISGYQYWYPINGLKYGVILGLHLGYILNLFWSIKVISALFRAIGISKKSISKSK
ncbi:hypothetical protein FRACYDRAFT_244886 [Fragilariopsis cylindrus CCMP1102]|uniref:TLC domain-containing protein n=1 Tax=Fragilariopsis cylindrus CCMP1102 TaxID=635003 RepID=A0A1E7F1S3_9STRA|nr:hypothetical protein FRACYDRAFT_244886 [Fragilariopsis cylindrus CCMP1102]|eukprot:OEU11763.1 hypothetical protein FRACYDRAFT_244886 [Fragilariopsis cylindrus CCMP1102]